MKKKFFWLPIFLCVAILSCSLYCTSSDDENYDIIWRKANSPIYIDSCFVVPAGEILKIEPGVEVRFKSSRSSADFHYDSLRVGMLHVRGSIIARGTKNDSIIFTRNGDEGSWAIICIDSTSGAINSFKYCKMLHSGQLFGLYESCDYGLGGRYDCGSVFFHKSTGKVQECYFNDNYCGVFYYNSTEAQIKNNRFVDNAIDVFCEEYSTVDIEGNTCVNHLAGWYTPYSSIRSNKSSLCIMNNYFTGYFYTIYCAEMSNLQIEGNTFESAGAGIFATNILSGDIMNNIMKRMNYSIIFVGSSIPIINNLISNSQLGICCTEESNPRIINNTITTSEYMKELCCGIGCELSANPIIYNTVVNGYMYNLYIDGKNSHPTIAYSFIQSDSLPSGFEDGGNNILNAGLDPLFVDEENGDYQLQESSPCVNAGKSSAPDLPETDILGNPRISGSEVDIGAYEFQR